MGFSNGWAMLGLLTLMSLCVFAANLQPVATVRVDPQKVLGKVNRMVFGNNQLGYQYGAWEYTAPEYADRGAGIWDPERSQPVPEMVKFARDIGMSTARYPGGCGSHLFDWKKSVGPVEKRPKQRFGLPEFLKFCEAVGAVPVITVADYFGTPQDAADLVEYLNSPDDGKHRWAKLRAMDGRKEPWKVVWFEFGNETDHGAHKGMDDFGKWQRFTPEEYARRYREYWKAMKSVDPNIKLGAVLANDVTPTLSDWTKTVVKLTGDIADFYIHHAYIPHYYRNDGFPDSKTLFKIALAGPRQIEAYYRELQNFIRETTGRNIPIAVTEFNGHFVQEKPIPYRFTLGCALIVAELLQIFMKPELNIAHAQYWQFANEYWGMVKGYSPPYTLRPAYWVFWLYHQYFGDLLINCQVDCESYETEGGYGVLLARCQPTRFQLFPTNLLPQQNWALHGVNGAKHWEEPDGTLVVEILTDDELNYYHAVKRMPAEPLTGYRVTAEIRTEGLTKSRGAQIQVGDGRGWLVTKSASLSPEVKSEVWQKVSVDYITLPDTNEIEIRVRRLEGEGSRGKIFVRNLQVQKFTPFNLGAVPVLSAVASKSRDGKRVSVAVINKNLDNSTKVCIVGFKAKRATAWSLTGPSVDATNEINPNLVQPRRLKEVFVKGNEVFVALPPHSFTVVVLE
ncbi:MAG: alpha-L-arabinofuranosidase C-terminal domain-containing protein [Armatimonadota bacterium]|nr:hypothetical protein [Armatimonadota bacterium]MDW8143841.1 alpha-L-arabinofuranosidase C-terminal domain-containing protein [Armatimonadota bacterium]